MTRLPRGSEMLFGFAEIFISEVLKEKVALD